MATLDSHAGDTWLIVAAGAQRVALAQALVREVVRSAALPPGASVPMAPRFVLGLTSLRGRPLTVVHLGRLLGLPEAGDRSTQRAACVVVQGFDTTQPARPALALEVDRVLRIVDARHAVLEAAPAFGGPLPAACLRGVLTLDGQPVPALDLAAALAAAQASAQAGAIPGEPFTHAAV